MENQEARWYVLHTFSGYENVAKENLEIVIDKYNLQDRIFDIVIPMEDVIEDKNGKKKLVQKKVMPCYLLVKMIYGDDLWHNITRTRGITGFVGPKGRPLALTDDEVMKMRLEKINMPTTLEVGDKIEVIEGALNTMIGTIISVDNEGQRAKVNLEMFGRETPVDLEYSQIRKITNILWFYLFNLNYACIFIWKQLKYIWPFKERLKKVGEKIHKTPLYVPKKRRKNGYQKN